MESSFANRFVLATILSLIATVSTAAATELRNENELPSTTRMLSFDAKADPTCTRGFRNPFGRLLCCAKGCSQCGGTGCAEPGGAEFCCGIAITESGRSCDNVGAPCLASAGFPSSGSSGSENPDPTCARGIEKKGICCPSGCDRCGGGGCEAMTPPGAPAGACCRRVWRNGARTCDEVGAPCRLVRTPPPPPPVNVPTPVVPPTPVTEAPPVAAAPTRDVSRWVTITDTLSGAPTPRHEACMAWSGGKGYLIGGRGEKAVDIFDPAAKTWTKGTGPGFVMHHMQCVAWRGKVWVVSAWTGGFPKEEAVEDVWVYDTGSDSWSTRPGLPTRRLRGGGAQVLYDDKVWVLGGNVGGHGAHATTLGWTDYFDLVTEKWTTDLADLPEGRDHVQGALVNGKMLCVSGGRDGGVADFFTATITSTYCYLPDEDVWQNMKADLPGRGRGGIMATTTCEGHYMIVGGERLSGAASDQVDIFDGVKWTTSTSLNRGRHGGGLVTSDCGTCGKIYAVSGSGSRGGGPELDSTETYLSSGVDTDCTRF